MATKRKIFVPPEVLDKVIYSHHIFVICMEKLSHIIAEALRDDRWSPMRAGRNGPVITHLMFADDLLLFGEATRDHANVVLDCINNFYNLSGQKVNTEKTSIFFSKNVRHEVRSDICNSMGFKNSTNGRVRRDTYKKIIDKINNRLVGWKTSTLSFARRATLAKSVIGYIPIYSMRVNRLPRSICVILRKLNVVFYGAIVRMK